MHIELTFGLIFNVDGGFGFPYRLEVRLVRMLGTRIGAATASFEFSGEPPEVTNRGSCY